MNEATTSSEQTQPDIFQHRGWWWRTMGFTRTHIIGVFVTETFLGIVGVGFAVAGFLQSSAIGSRCLLLAVCFFLVQLSVLLSSILSLLFYFGSRVERATDARPVSSELPTPIPNERSA